MRILVTGVNGQLGHDVVNELLARHHDPIPTDKYNLDITEAQSVASFLLENKPDAVIHCAAFTAVDKAEDEPELCRKVNVEGTANLAQGCRSMGIKMMYISTDYVFAGKGTHFQSEDDPTGPTNVYGQTKLDGELVVKTLLERYFIVRISWVFGLNGSNFVKTMLRLGRQNGKVSVVNDQFGSPTYTLDLARLLVDMIETDRYGVYHAPNQGICSWYEFACAIFKEAQMDVVVTPVDSSAFPVKALRPLNSRMSQDRLVKEGFTPLPSWQDALRRYLIALKETDSPAI